MRENISLNDIKESFSSLQEEGSREYELSLTKIAELVAKNEKKELLSEIIDSNDLYAYEAFYCLCIIHRRNKDFELLKALLDKNSRFSDRITFNHLVVQYLVNSETFYDFDALLNMSFQDTKVFKDNAGYFQAFCNAFVTITDQCDKDSRDCIVANWYDIALESIDKAIMLDPNYAKYYCTKARIVGLRNEYTLADKLINLAISKEKSSRPDYVLTIQNYQYYRLKLMIQKAEYEINQRLIEIDKNLESVYENAETEKKTVESLGLTPRAYSGTGDYVFVSYAHSDKQSVYNIIGKLQVNNINIWFDEGIHAGEEWPEVIAQHIVDSDMVLVMLSSNSIQSANVRREVNLAISEKKIVIVVRLDDVPLSPGMKLQFSLYQMITKDINNEKILIDKLVSAISYGGS